MERDESEAAEQLLRQALALATEASCGWVLGGDEPEVGVASDCDVRLLGRCLVQQVQLPCVQSELQALEHLHDGTACKLQKTTWTGNLVYLVRCQIELVQQQHAPIFEDLVNGSK
jgi:hypothetical protein